MNKETFIKLMQGALFIFDDVKDVELLLRREYSYNDIQKAKKIKKFVEELENGKI